MLKTLSTALTLLVCRQIPFLPILMHHGKKSLTKTAMAWCGNTFPEIVNSTLFHTKRLTSSCIDSIIDIEKRWDKEHLMRCSLIPKRNSLELHLAVESVLSIYSAHFCLIEL